MLARLWLPAFVLLLGSGLWVVAHSSQCCGPNETQAAAQHQHGPDPSPEGQAVTLKGEVVDLSCYLSGSKCSLQCAQACAKKGLPMGLLTADGKLYLFIEDHGRAEAYREAVGRAGQGITVQGRVFEKGGLRAIQVQAASG